MRGAVGDDAAIFEDEHAVSQGKDLFAVVGYVENRNAVGCVPDAQVLDDLRFSGRVERS